VRQKIRPKRFAGIILIKEYNVIMNKKQKKRYKQLKESIKQGYSIVCYPKFNFKAILKFWMVFPFVAIQKYQKAYFGKGSDYKPTHIVHYLNDNHILNVTMPRAKWSSLEEIARSNYSLLIIKYTKHDWSEKDCNDVIKAMESETTFVDDKNKRYKMKLIGSKYDLGQLFAIMSNGIGGYPNEFKKTKLDSSRAREVCSAGIAVSYAYLRHLRESEGDESWSRLFSNGINESLFKDAKWGKEVVNDYLQNNRVDVEMTTPAHFTNSEYFCDPGEQKEFRIVRYIK
jgi:hypothetical protein